MVCGLRLYIAPVEEVARYQDEIYSSAKRVTLDNVTPGAEEIARAVGQVVSLYPKMNVSYVKKLRHKVK
jgi:hypothetical protein